MTREEITRRVQKCIAESICVNDDTIRLEQTLDDLGADSLDRVEIVLQIEDEFLIEIPDEDGEKLTSVRAMVDYVSGRVPA